MQSFVRVIKCILVVHASGKKGLQTHPEVGFEDMWPSDLQLPSSLAIPGKLVALVIHDTHVHEEVRPPLAGSVMQLLFLT